MNNRQQTPLEKLLADKIRLQEECRVQEQKLNNTLSYFQENAGSLLISGFSNLLFPTSKNKNKAKDTKEITQKESKIAGQSVSLNLNDYLSIAKSLLPVAWEIAQPIIINWGIRKTKKMITSIFQRKKK